MSSPYSDGLGSPSVGPVQPVPAYQSGRPTGVTVFAIICTLFGIVGLLSPVVTLLPMLINWGENPVADVIEQNAIYKVYFFGMMAFNFLFSILLLVSGLGLFRMASWARSGVLGYAFFTILSVLVGAVMNALFLFGPMIENLDANGGPEIPPEIARLLAVGFSILGSCIGLILPLAILIYFLMPSVKLAFRASPTPVA